MVKEFMQRDDGDLGGIPLLSEEDLTNLPNATFDESLFENYMVFNESTQTKTSNSPAPQLPNTSALENGQSLENYFSNWTPEIDSPLPASFENASGNAVMQAECVENY